MYTVCCFISETKIYFSCCFDSSSGGWGGGGGGGLGSGEYACMLDLAWKTVSYDEFIPSNRVILLNEKVTERVCWK